MSNREAIDLQRALTSKEAEILAGNDRGQYFRTFFRLDECDKDSAEYAVLFPDRISAISLSFFLGMFGPSILSLDRDGFSRKYEFECKPSICRTVERGIERAMKTKQAQSSA